MGGAAKTIGRVGSGVLTLGGSEIARKTLGQRSPISQLLQAPGTIMTGGASGPDGMPSLFGGGQAPNPYVSGPFSLDPNQVNKDQSEILGLGNKQYGDTMQLGQDQYQKLLGGIDTNSAAQTQRAKDLFGQMLPDIAENSQAAHLYDSTGYGQEVGRQQSGIASQIASEEAQQKLAALQGLQGNQTSSLQGRQGFETGALQRGQSLEDFINQANVAKTIGAQMAPAPPSGKQNFGTVASGVGALAPMAKLAKGAGGVATGNPALAASALLSSNSASAGYGA